MNFYHLFSILCGIFVNVDSFLEYNNFRKKIVGNILISENIRADFDTVSFENAKKMIIYWNKELSEDILENSSYVIWRPQIEIYLSGLSLHCYTSPPVFNILCPKIRESIYLIVVDEKSIRRAAIILKQFKNPTWLEDNDFNIEKILSDSLYKYYICKLKYSKLIYDKIEIMIDAENISTHQ